MDVARNSLRLHPACPPCPVQAIETAISREDRRLHLRFALQGDIGLVALPAPRAPRAADGLWAHTCCEAFVAVAGSAAYREFNFSPSGEWAIYDFDGYRARREGDGPLPAPLIAVSRGQAELVLEATLDVPAIPAGSPLQLGLTAVVEGLDGTLSYWALHHAGARPDFHLRDAFTLTLARP